MIFTPFYIHYILINFEIFQQIIYFLLKKFLIFSNFFKLKQGNIKQKPVLPTKLAFFSDKLPSCSGHTYGYLLNTEPAKQMETMQRALSITTKRRKNLDLLNYA